MTKTLTISAIITSVILLSGILGFSLSNPDAFAAKGGTAKVTICHIPPGNPANAHTITVSEKAVPAHLAHGDTLGPCLPPPPPTATCAAPQIDRCIDVDGTLTPTDGIGTGQAQVIGGITVLSFFPTVNFIGSGLDMFDNDGDGQWTFDTDGAGPLGDDLHVEDFTFCPTAIRDGLHQPGLDCVVLDPDSSLFRNQQVDCDLEVGAVFTVCPPFAGANAVTYHDANGNMAWDDGEDIILDVNGNGIFD